MANIVIINNYSFIGRPEAFKEWEASKGNKPNHDTQVYWRCRAWGEGPGCHSHCLKEHQVEGKGKENSNNFQAISFTKQKGEKGNKLSDTNISVYLHTNREVGIAKKTF